MCVLHRCSKPLLSRHRAQRPRGRPAQGALLPGDKANKRLERSTHSAGETQGNDPPIVQEKPKVGPA